MRALNEDRTDMLRTLRIRNFKAWQDTGELRFAPLTLLFGANSVGKSSLGQALLALQQTVRRPPRDEALRFGDARAPVDLGSYAACIHRHELRRRMGFMVDFTLPDETSPTGSDPVRRHLQLDAELYADEAGLARVARQDYRLCVDDHEEVRLLSHRAPTGAWRVVRSLPRLPPEATRGLLQPPHFHALPRGLHTARRGQVDFTPLARAITRLLQRLQFLGPVRAPPRRQYTWDGRVPASIGQAGEHTIAALLAAQEQGRTVSRGPRAKSQPFAAFIAQWLQELGVVDGFRLEGEGEDPRRVLLRTRHSRQGVPFTDAGFGISQLLPALVAPFYCPPHSTVWVEQPELHLHPRLQADLADLYLCALRAHENGRPRQVQLVIESHSEYFLTRLLRRIAEEALKPEEVAIYMCRSGPSGAEVEPLRVNTYGEIENWPDRFFGDEMADLSARTLHALRRRQAAQPEEPQ